VGPYQACRIHGARGWGRPFHLRCVASYDTRTEIGKAASHWAFLEPLLLRYKKNGLPLVGRLVERGYSITSSAATSSFSGTVRPSDFAVLTAAPLAWGRLEDFPAKPHRASH
jgi:hypothetical protein